MSPSAPRPEAPLHRAHGAAGIARSAAADRAEEARGFRCVAAARLQRGVERVLNATTWNKARAARVLEVDIKTLNKKIRDFKLAPAD